MRKRVLFELLLLVVSHYGIRLVLKETLIRIFVFFNFTFIVLHLLIYFLN